MAELTFRTVFVLAIVTCLMPSFIQPARQMQRPYGSLSGVNGDSTCMACTLVVTLLQQFMQVYEFTSEESIDFFCNLQPDIFYDACELAKPRLYEALANKLNSTDSSDVICYSIGACYVEEGYHYCHLFPEPEGGMENAVQASRAMTDHKPLTNGSPICEIDGFGEICELFGLRGMIDDKTPTFDEDKDTYSTVENYRGYDWRGQDCVENNPDAYPGKLPTNSDIDYDSNCNGIWGVNPDTGIPYEEELCGDQENYGIIMIGDSIGAHFHIPPDWFRANVTSAELVQNLTFIAANELDWPHMSFATGFVNGTWEVTINSPTNSLYWRLRDRNLCVHRDYQNLAFNGAKSTSAYENSLNMTRDEGSDKPVILVYAEFGNDICRSHHGIVDEMTPVDEFTDAVLEYLDYLDTRLPKNSHIVLVGLVNGTYLYDILKGRLHPIGELNQDITYDDLYNWFSCMQEVCPGWTNTNVTQQELATEHAMELSNALKQIAANANFSRFDVHYQDSPLDAAVEQWTGEKWQLIEPVDGLHPSKYGQDLFAKIIWETIEQQYPEILEAINVNNGKIREVFGDQGGH